MHVCCSVSEEKIRADQSIGLIWFFFLILLTNQTSWLNSKFLISGSKIEKNIFGRMITLFTAHVGNCHAWRHIDNLRSIKTEYFSLMENRKFLVMCNWAVNRILYFKLSTPGNRGDNIFASAKQICSVSTLFSVKSVWKWGEQPQGLVSAFFFSGTP